MEVNYQFDCRNVVMLVAGDDVQGFYRGSGFEQYADVMARFSPERLYDGENT